MYSKLIKRYKYNTSKEQKVVKKQQILKRTMLEHDILHESPEITFRNVLKKGQFQELDLSLFNSNKTDSQKKKADAKSSSPNKLNETKARTSVGALKKDSPKNNSTNVQASSLNIGDSKANLNNANRRSIEDVLKKEHEARLKKETEKSYKIGFRDGHKNGLDEAGSKTDQINRVLNTITEELNEKSQNFFNEVEDIVMDLSVHLAKKIIFGAVDMVPDIVKANVENCVKLLAGAGQVIIKINPADYDIIKEYIPGLDQKHEGKFSFVIEPDNSITRGGCLIELNGSVVDGRIETQFEKLKQHMEMLV
ncbi:MAG: hypothetical protein J7K40_05705 [candidate division Zixibacteria bacterium]|nr:hypothetical protein [candidate division Zixibacteria bacterium]